MNTTIPRHLARPSAEGLTEASRTWLFYNNMSPSTENELLSPSTSFTSSFSSIMADNATLEQAQFAEFVSQYVQHSLSDPDTLLASAEPSNLTFRPDPTGPHGRWADNTLFMAL